MVHSSGKKISFGSLVEQARKIATPIDSEIILKDKKDFKYIGKGLPSIDMNDFTRGTAIFGLDARLPNMKYAAIARCPVTFGTIKSIDDSNAKGVYGVEAVIQLDRIKPALGAQFYGMLGGVAVIANNT